MFDIEGRAKSARKILKAHQSQHSEQPSNGLQQVSALSLHNIVLDHRARMRKADAPTRLRRRVLKAVRPENLRMQSNGIPQGLRLIKDAHRQPRELHGDFLPDLHKQVTFPPQSRNAMNDDARADDGARLASDSADDEMTMRPSANIIGGQPINDVSASASISAAVDAIKKDMARGAKPFLQ